MRSVRLSFPPDTATATWSSGLNMSQWLMVRRTFRSNESLKQLLHRIVPSYSLWKYPGLRLHTVQDLESIDLSRKYCTEQDVGQNYVGAQKTERHNTGNCPYVLGVLQAQN